MNLTEKQEAMLRAAIKTNGGGLSGINLDQRVMRSLEKKQLIQGKAGNQSRVVHTSIGLEWVRSKDRAALAQGGDIND